MGVTRDSNLCAVRRGVEQVLRMRVEGAKGAGELRKQIVVRAGSCEGTEEHVAAVRLEAPARGGSIPGALDTCGILGDIRIDDR